MPMQCTTEKRSMTAALSGEIDHHTARRMMLALEREIGSRFPRTLVLDFSAVTFMDSSGLALLLRTARRMQEVSGTMRVVGVAPQPAKVMRAANLDKMLSITFQSEAG